MTLDPLIPSSERMHGENIRKTRDLEKKTFDIKLIKHLYVYFN